MKKTVYLDSTILSYLYDKRESLHPYIEATKAWWQTERPCFDCWISEEVIAELSYGDYPRKQAILHTAATLPVLPPESRIIGITQVYLENYLMPQEHIGDAVHLAYASFYKCDFLLTWNWTQLANANKYQHIRIINARLQLATPDIITPLELFTEGTSYA
jgi:predicted nucleic acid-binding protein